MSLTETLRNLMADGLSGVKVAALSRPVSLRPEVRTRPLIVMGNGPSLKPLLDDPRLYDGHADLLAVNFAAVHPSFQRLRPQWYVLMDPLFFSGQPLPNLQALQQALASVSWPMTLVVPRVQRRNVPAAIAANPHITIATINAVGIDGTALLSHLLYRLRLAMPRPRNVLIPALMAAMQAGYTHITIVGADHSWMRSLWVDDRNHVVSVQPHFYAEDSAEQKRVDSEYAGYRLHQIVQSFYVAFSAYHRIERYARSRGVTILNATPDSMIDAFQRTKNL